MQSSVTRPRVVPPRVVPPRVRPARLPAADAASGPDRTGESRVIRRVVAGALMSVVFVGGTAGTALAATRDVPSEGVPAVVRPAAASPTAPITDYRSPALTGSTTVFTWPTPSTETSGSSTKSTAVRVIDSDYGVVHRAGTATRIVTVWAVAATLAAVGVLAGSLLRR
ncbi:hypothetical protein [Cryptosporangium minutisporangium]|uniref:Uncharacterized protein n=1 Tax=Cryptosporangium minutisporangium TaxID=113569 RepID=A0ABP6T4P4_9ACTN